MTENQPQNEPCECGSGKPYFWTAGVLLIQLPDELLQTRATTVKACPDCVENVRMASAERFLHEYDAPEDTDVHSTVWDDFADLGAATEYALGQREQIEKAIAEGRSSSVKIVSELREQGETIWELGIEQCPECGGAHLGVRGVKTAWTFVPFGAAYDEDGIHCVIAPLAEAAPWSDRLGLNEDETGWILTSMVDGFTELHELRNHTTPMLAGSAASMDALSRDLLRAEYLETAMSNLSTLGGLSHAELTTSGSALLGKTEILIKTVIDSLQGQSLPPIEAEFGAAEQEGDGQPGGRLD